MHNNGANNIKNDQIKVLQIIGSVVGGGVESVVLNYFKYINHNQFRFDFIVDRNPLPYFLESVKTYNSNIYTVTSYKSNILAYTYQIYKIVKNGNYDIVHSHMSTMSLFPLFAAYFAGANVRILHNHTTTEKGEKIKSILKYMLRPLCKIFATHYCACSEVAARWMYGNRWREKCHIIYDAIEINKFLYDKKIRNIIRGKINVTDDTLVIGNVGRLVYQKNHKFLINIFSKVLKIHPNSLLILIGDGPLKYDLIKMAKSLNIEDKIFFLGVQSNVNEWLQAIDIFIFPSWYEGLGMAAIEAQINGNYTIMSNYIPKEACISKNSVFLNINDGATMWAEKTVKIFQSYIKNGIIDIDEKYSINTQCHELERYYNEILRNY